MQAAWWPPRVVTSSYLQRDGLVSLYANCFSLHYYHMNMHDITLEVVGKEKSRA